MKFFTKFTLALLVVFSIALSSRAQEGDMQEVMAGLTEMLDLSDTQVGQVQALLTEYRGKLDGVLLKYEDEEEPDVGAMIGEIRGVRDGYRKDLQGVLSKDQYSTYMAQVNSVLQGMFNDLAEIRLMDVQEQTSLTDAQVEQLTPIIGKSLLSTVQLLFENAGTRLSVPKKVSIGKTMKKIQKEQRAGLEQVLTPKQLAAYDKYKEEQKAKK